MNDIVKQPTIGVRVVKSSEMGSNSSSSPEEATNKELAPQIINSESHKKFIDNIFSMIGKVKENN